METDWKKKYEEALERARKYHGGDEGTLVCIEDMLEDVFPELAESEDEKIRKWLYDYISNCPNNNFAFYGGVGKDAVLNYLKKQKETLHIPETCKENADSFTDEDERLQKEQKPPIAGNDFGWIDELMHDFEHPEELDQKVDDVLKQRRGIKDLEWSEEDEKMRELLIAIFETNHPNGFFKANEINTTDMRGVHTEEIVSWLKSLRPQPHWKPSEEDINAIGREN